MWILTEHGYVHSGRVVAIRPPIHKDDRTLRVSLTGKRGDDIRGLREDVEKFLGKGDAIKAEGAQLSIALRLDNERRKEEKELADLKRTSKGLKG